MVGIFIYHDGMSFCDISEGISNYRGPLIGIFGSISKSLRVRGYVPELDTTCPNEFSIVLYSNILFSSDSCEFLPIN